MKIPFYDWMERRRDAFDAEEGRFRREASGGGRDLTADKFFQSTS